MCLQDKVWGRVVIYGVPLGPLGGRTFIVRVNLKCEVAKARKRL